MCGILGFISSKTKLDTKLFELSLQEMICRGPDDKSTKEINNLGLLGFTRLSIVDAPSSFQPLSNKENNVHLLFNGEIYNFLELKKVYLSGYRFKTQGDGEVILALYLQMGLSFINYLRGMYAIAIIDERNSQLLLTRDKFGEKPLFYTLNKESVSFSSTLSPLLKLNKNKFRLNQIGIYEYFRSNYFRNGLPIRNINQVPRDGTVIVDLKSFKVLNLYKKEILYKNNPLNSNTTENLIKKFENQIVEAVQNALTGDNLPSLLLSSGVDSAVIASTLVRSGIKVDFYTLDFYNRTFSEFDNANKVAKQLDSHSIKLDFIPEQLPDIAEMLNKMGEPLGDSSALAVWSITSSLNKLGVKSCLSGDGGDELLGGYKTYDATILAGRLFVPKKISSMLNFINLSSFLAEGSSKVGMRTKLKRFLYGLQFEQEYRHPLWNYAWSENDIKELFPNSNLSPMMKVENSKVVNELKWNCQKFDIDNYLQNDILIKSDRASMANSVEIRAPLLDRNFTEFVLSPEIQELNLKLNKKYGSKGLFKYLLEIRYGLHLPNKQKLGFSVPINELVRERYAEEIKGIFESLKSQNLIQLNHNYLLRKFDNHINRKENNGFAIWGTALLILWINKHSNKLTLEL